MDTRFIGSSVCGASHKRCGLECQDSHKFVDKGDVMILAVADGHGSAACPYSKSGSQIAVNVFCQIMSGYCDKYSGDLQTLLTFFNREGDTMVARSIDTVWKQRVWKNSYAKLSKTLGNYDEKGKKTDKKSREFVFTQYGTTLVGLLVTPLFRFAFQIGDGDMFLINESGVVPLLDTEKILGVETHSLSKREAWKKAVTSVQRLDNGVTEPYAYILTTDGFANSYPNEDGYIEALKGYFEAVNEHGCDAVKENLDDWLSQTSEQGCGDDVTLLMAYRDSLQSTPAISNLSGRKGRN